MQTSAPSHSPHPKTLESHSDQHVRIAYFIMIHHKPEVFKAMFEKIYTRDQFYLIHIDRKAKDEITDEIQMYLVRFPNVYILESINIVSGGFSMIQAELDAMEFLLNVSQEWDYFVNLSGEDYPLKSQNVIRQFLTLNKGRNYLFYYDQKFYRPDTLQRIQNHFTELSYKISSLIYKREFMKDVTPYIGGKWVIFTRDTCAFLANNKKVMNFEDYYLHTLLPAESFFQTVLMNTSFNDLIVNDDKRAIIEKPIFGKKQTADDLIHFLKTTNHLFIRKINEKTDKEVLKYIAESYDFPLPEVDEVERELKRDKRQDN
ncbi:glycosyl transferase [Chryseobacterium shigense]|uniref:Peptide O-xylosyltransferase n=1 Tax=Chryseobacterium shigense TaxID=297244 RepID=A0A1N7I7E9_9FLAO|nr:beta-1,6-N-acetylglucosaminyltransferase [Chryseobacterium shigense]PQA97243.1 glycosyl transferase [Chryseobacterium shigense]SIS32930.1 Core-2/I-Branching enzyme [Chryseobacterium shigense]